GLEPYGAGELQGECLNPPGVGPRHARRDPIHQSLTPGSPSTPEPGLAPLASASVLAVVLIKLPLAAGASVVEHPTFVGDAPDVPSVLPDHIGPGSDQSKPGLGQDRVRQMLGLDEKVARAEDGRSANLLAGMGQLTDQRLGQADSGRRLDHRPEPAHIVRGLTPHSNHLRLPLMECTGCLRILYCTLGPPECRRGGVSLLSAPTPRRRS